MAYDAVLSIDELNSFFDSAFDEPRAYTVGRLESPRLWMVMAADAVHLRPGDTISGPTLMTLADAAAYAVVLAHLGPVELAVTSNLTINFFRKPPPAGLIAEAELLKLGRKLATADVRLRSETGPELVAQATVTYAIPSGLAGG